MLHEILKERKTRALRLQTLHLESNPGLARAPFNWLSEADAP